MRLILVYENIHVKYCRKPSCLSNKVVLNYGILKSFANNLNGSEIDLISFISIL